MKKTILIPITASIMCLGALALVPTKTERVSADGPTYYKYFLLDENEEYGLVPGYNPQGTTSVAAAASLNNPLLVRPTGTNQYQLSIIVGNNQYYAKADSNQTAFDLTEANASTWSLNHLEGNKYEITADSTYSKLGFYNKNSVRRFGTTEGTKSDYNYTLTLLSVDSAVNTLVNAIKSVDCSKHNPSLSQWQAIGTAYNAIHAVILNYLDLENAEADKDAADTTLEWAMAKYDYVCGKYNESRGFIDYLNRNPSYPTDGVNNFTTTKVESNNLTIIVTVMSLITIASVTSLLFFKRKSK